MSLNILLINPILSKTDFESPLGLLYISKVCREAGHATKIVDLSFEYNFDYLKKYISSASFDIAGIYAMSSMMHKALEVAGMIKDNKSDAKIVLGGPHPTLLPEEVLINRCVDFVVMGEGERTALELFDAIEKRKFSYQDIKGIGYKNGNEIVINERRDFIKDLDVLPFPDRSELDTLEGYINLPGTKILFGHRVLNIIASRGCYFNCAFCQPALAKIHGREVRCRSIDNVISEIAYLKANWRIDSVWFEDDTFTFKKDWLLGFCEAMIKRNMDVTWSCNSRIDTVDRDILEIMKRAGCIQIRYGMESGSQIMLDDDFNKGTRLSDVKRIFKMTHETGIKIYCYVMIGGRHETLDSIDETRRFLKVLLPDHVQLAITTPLPYTRFREELVSDKDIRIVSSSYEDIKLFEKCNFDTKYLKAADLELIYRRIVNEFHFFKFSSLMTKDIISWIEKNLQFVLFLIKSKRNNRFLFTIKVFLSYLKLCLRLFFLKIPLLKDLERFIFKKNLKFPPL